MKSSKKLCVFIFRPSKLNFNQLLFPKNNNREPSMFCWFRSTKPWPVPLCSGGTGELQLYRCREKVPRTNKTPPPWPWRRCTSPPVIAEHVCLNAAWSLGPTFGNRPRGGGNYLIITRQPWGPFTLVVPRDAYASLRGSPINTIADFPQRHLHG